MQAIPSCSRCICRGLQAYRSTISFAETQTCIASDCQCACNVPEVCGFHHHWGCECDAACALASAAHPLRGTREAMLALHSNLTGDQVRARAAAPRRSDMHVLVTMSRTSGTRAIRIPTPLSAYRRGPGSRRFAGRRELCTSSTLRRFLSGR